MFRSSGVSPFSFVTYTTLNLISRPAQSWALRQRHPRSDIFHREYWRCARLTSNGPLFLRWQYHGLSLEFDGESADGRGTGVRWEVPYFPRGQRVCRVY